MTRRESPGDGLVIVRCTGCDRVFGLPPDTHFNERPGARHPVGARDYYCPAKLCAGYLAPVTDEEPS